MKQLKMLKAYERDLAKAFHGECVEIVRVRIGSDRGRYRVILDRGGNALPRLVGPHAMTLAQLDGFIQGVLSLNHERV